MDTQTKIQVQNYLKQFYAKRWFITVFVTLCMIGVLFYLYQSRNVYRSVATILVEDATPAPGLELLSRPSQAKKIQNHIHHLKSYHMADRVLQKVKEMQTEYPFIFEIFDPEYQDKFQAEEQRILWIKNRFNAIILDQKANILEISFEAHKPEEAAAFSNIYQSTYLEENLDLVDQELIVLKNYLQEQKYEKETLLNTAEKSLNTYMKDEGIKQFEEQSTSELNNISEMKQKLESYRIDLEGALEERRLIEKELEANNKNLSANQIKLNKNYFGQISKEISDWKAKKENMIMQLKNQGISLETYKNTLDFYDTKIKSLEKQLDEQLALKSKETASSDPFKLNDDLRKKYIELGIEVQRLQKAIALTERYLKENNIESTTLPDKQLQLTRLKRQVQIYEELYVMVTKKLEETKIQLSSRKNNVKVIDTARIDTRVVYPQKMKFVGAGFLASLVLALGLVFIQEYLDNTIKTEDEIKAFGLSLIKFNALAHRIG